MPFCDMFSMLVHITKDGQTERVHLLLEKQVLDNRWRFIRFTALPIEIVMKSYQIALFTLLFTSVLFSCKRDDVAPEEEDTFKVVVSNEGGIQNFTQQMAFVTKGVEAGEVEISGAEWDKVYDHEIEGEERPSRVFEKEQMVPRTITYESNVDLHLLQYNTIIQSKDESGATMRTKIAFYRAGELIGEKVYDIEGKGSAITVTFLEGYDMFDQDFQQPL